MSLEIYFAQKIDAKQILVKDYEEYFSNRKYYTRQKNEVAYFNDETGVHFYFDFFTDDIDEYLKEDDDLRIALLNKGLKHTVIAFNINFARPHIFGLEAAPELLNFTENFGFAVIYDYDEIIMQYSSEDFLKRWMSINFTAGYKMILEINRETPSNVYSLPTEELKRHWRWNMERDFLRDRIKQNVFVPRIMYFRHNGCVKSFCTWPDTIPIVLPKVDAVLLFLDKIAPKKLYGRRKIGYAPVDFSKLEQLSPILVRGEEDGIYYCIERYKDPKVIAFFRAQPYLEGKLEQVSIDDILNKEPLEEAKKLRNET